MPKKEKDPKPVTPPPPKILKEGPLSRWMRGMMPSTNKKLPSQKGKKGKK